MKYEWLLSRLAHIVIATALSFVGAGILVMDTLLIVWGLERNSSASAWMGITAVMVFVTVLAIGVLVWFIVWVMNKIPDIERTEDIPRPSKPYEMP
jgi:heme/copper-type cytochrome/quinol oxidase subunit 2